MKGIYLLLGSNINAPRDNIMHAINELALKSDLKAVSKLYHSEPWGNSDQPSFVNQIVEIETQLAPAELLKTILAIEESMGRIRKSKWGERLIDIDLLYYNDEIIDSTSLKVPHREIQNRRFTLLPMNDIAAGFIHPVMNKTQNELLEECLDKSWVRQLIIDN